MSSLPRRLLLSSVVLGSALAAASAVARGPGRFAPAEASSLALTDADSEPLPTYYRDGVTYVLGVPGERYQIRIDNPFGERVEAVVSVDGRDAVSGRKADYYRQRGYVLPAYGSVTIDGFRQSLERTAAFRFVDPSRSYSARLGTPENVGIVGVAFFRARPVRTRPLPRPYRSEQPSSRDLGEARRGAEPSHLGTEYGESRESRVTETRFERRSGPPERVLTLRYDDADGLIARGIVLYPHSPHFVADAPSGPEAFPDSRFAAPPPRYWGPR